MRKLEGLRILLVHPAAPERAALCELLDSRGAVIAVASDVDEALRCLPGPVADLVICDAALLAQNSTLLERMRSTVLMLGRPPLGQEFHGAILPPYTPDDIVAAMEGLMTLYFQVD